MLPSLDPLVLFQGLGERNLWLFLQVLPQVLAVLSVKLVQPEASFLDVLADAIFAMLN
jgi:hypothetical protein